MATTSIRHLVILELMDRVATALPGVRVDACWPGDELEMESVYVADTIGSLTVPVFGPARLTRDDRFDVRMVVQGGSPQSDTREAMERAALLLAAVEDVLADNPGLGAMDGVVSIGHAIQVEGPNTFPARNGVFTYYLLTISAHARYD